MFDAEIMCCMLHRAQSIAIATACRAFGHEITLHEALNLTPDRGDRTGARPSRVL
jgi:hypothetical protein